MSQIGYQDVLTFWFDEIDPKMWWASDEDFDGLIRDRFEGTHQKAARGELFLWRHTAKGRLAEVIVLDQFSRNIYRGSVLAFAQDPMALVLAQEAVSARAHLSLSGSERNFLLMPFMHSESVAIHEYAVPLFRDHATQRTYEFELQHKAIIDRFGRYPHRNEVLGRVSSDDEIEFLQKPGSRF